jgi:hypothetical protein
MENVDGIMVDTIDKAHEIVKRAVQKYNSWSSILSTTWMDHYHCDIQLSIILEFEEKI